MAAKANKTEATIHVPKANFVRMRITVLGKTPLLFNCMSEKAKHELLMPKGRKSAAERATTLKHDPHEEFRNSMYVSVDEKSPTHIVFPGAAFKKAIASAALDVPGANKSQIGRMVWVEEYNPAVYGIPQLKMGVVRSSDMNRTPDIRTWAILPEWTCTFTISFPSPPLSEEAIANLLGFAGDLIGVGDGRQEKGKLSFGKFETVEYDDPRVVRLHKLVRKQQLAAIAQPACFDGETEKLLTWFDDELKRTGAHVKRSKGGVLRNGKQEESLVSGRTIED